MSLLARLVFGSRQFRSEVELKNLLEDTFDKKPDEIFIASEMLLVFQGSQQHTWFCATAQALYCLFDVITEPEPRVKWRIPKEHIVKDGKIILKIETRDLSPVSGLIVVDGKRARKFTKRLFPDKQRDVGYYVRIMLYKAFGIAIENWGLPQE